jgi:hypothetical protein
MIFQDPLLLDGRVPIRTSTVERKEQVVIRLRMATVSGTNTTA